MQANYNQYRVLYFHIHAVNSFPGPTGDGATVRSGAGTNLKVGAPIRRKAPENVFWSCPSTFLALKVQLVVLASAFVMVSIQFRQFLVCCSSTHDAPCAQPFVKVGARAPVPYGVGATDSASHSVSVYTAHGYKIILLGRSTV